MTDPYPDFLRKASVALSPIGAVPLLAPGLQNDVPQGLEGWDQVLLADLPGQQTIFAFTRTDGSTAELQRRIDAFSAHVVGRGLDGLHAAHLVFVAVSDDGLDEGAKRVLSRSVPRAYYTGVRPTTWVVDLAEGSMTYGRSSAPGVAALAGAAASVAPVSEEEIQRARFLRARQEARSAEFYRLIRERRPIVTFTLVALDVLIYLLVLVRGGQSPGGFGTPTERALVDAGALVPALVQRGEVWRLFTEMFLHASVTHILFNMVSLLAVGVVTERLYGSTRFLAIFLGSGLIGAVASYAHSVSVGDVSTPALGASGAIFGVVGALLTLRFQHSEVVPAYVRRRISASMLPIVALNFGLGLTTPYVDNWAHGGGLLGGLALSLALPVVRGERKDPRPAMPPALNEWDEPPAGSYDK